MTDRWFERIYSAIRARRVVLLFFLAALMAVAVASIRFIPFENAIDVMLPDGGARDAIKFLTEASLADKVVVSVEKTDPAMSREEFSGAANRLAEKLRSTALIPVDPGAAAAGMMDFGKILALAPQLFGQAEQAAAEAAMTPEAVDKSLRELRADLAKPSSMFASRLARLDPLGVQRPVLARLERLSAANLYDVVLEDGQLSHRDGNHILLVFTTPVAITDSAGSRELVTHLDATLAQLPRGLRADAVCGHLHTVSNERIIKRDISRTTWIGGVAFILIFALVFRDWRAVFMLGMPTCAALLGLPLAALCHSSLSYLVAGFGMVIIGITSDYGIYVYVVTRRTARPAQEVRRIVRPMGLGMLTTACVFVAFYFSGIEGYRQLATFAIISIVLAWLAAIFILPHLLGMGAKPEGGDAFPVDKPAAPPAWPRFWVCATAAALLASGLLVARARFNTDITLLDGTDRRVIEAETRFEKTWSAGGNSQGVLAVTAPSYEEALARSEKLYDQLASQLGNRLLSFSTLWRSEGVRAANIARWNAFWTQERREAVKSRLLESGSRHGFSAAAFQPFSDQLAAAPDLREPPNNALFTLLKDRFVHKSAAGFTVFSFFPDTPECTGAISALAGGVPGVFCVSRRLLTDSLAASIGRTVFIVTVISFALVFLLTLLLTSTWRRALISLVPAAAGVLFALGVPAAIGHTLNLCHITAAAVVFGLCVDYGIYMTHAIAHRMEERGKTTIVLTTATSVIGSGVLLFTQHPVLFALGLTITAGMIAGHVTAIWGIPSFVELWGFGCKKIRPDHNCGQTECLIP
jgi:predicted exporter